MVARRIIPPRHTTPETLPYEGWLVINPAS